MHTVNTHRITRRWTTGGNTAETNYSETGSKTEQTIKIKKEVSTQ